MNGKTPYVMIGAVVTALLLLLGGAATALSISDRWATKVQVETLVQMLTWRLDRVERKLDELHDAIAPLPARRRD